MEIKGRTALITGGASGLGMATAQSVARAGGNVVEVWRKGPSRSTEREEKGLDPLSGRGALRDLAERGTSAVFLAFKAPGRPFAKS